MEKTEKHVIWQPNEEIYKAGDNPEGAYLIKSGYVYIYTSGGLKLIRKTHLRLIDSNAQSEELSKDLEKLMAMVKKTETISEDITKLVEQMRKKVNKTLSED